MAWVNKYLEEHEKGQTAKQIKKDQDETQCAHKLTQKIIEDIENKRSPAYKRITKAIEYGLRDPNWHIGPMFNMDCDPGGGMYSIMIPAINTHLESVGSVMRFQCDSDGPPDFSTCGLYW